MSAKRKATKDAKAPVTKKQNSSLETRLNSILCCVVCLDLSPSSIVQCANGHMMCTSCHTRLLADANIANSDPECPVCKKVVNPENCTRNLVAESTVAELMTQCSACETETTRGKLAEHLEGHCSKRICWCKFKILGFEWQGVWSKLLQHEATCEFLTKPPDEIISCLQARRATKHAKLMELLCADGSYMRDIKLTTGYVNTTMYESSFSINSISWKLKLEVVEDYNDEGGTVGRSLFYQLQLTKINTKYTQVAARFVAISSSINEANADIHNHLFKWTDTCRESPDYELYLANAEECNKLLSSRTINLRLIISFDVS